MKHLKCYYVARSMNVGLQIIVVLNLWPENVDYRFALWNSNSVLNRNCSNTIIELDLLAITETWLKDRDCDKIFITDLENACPDYNILQFPRLIRMGVGVRIILRKGF